MARIAGIDLPVQKRLWIGLTSIYGIGRERAKKLGRYLYLRAAAKTRSLVSWGMESATGERLMTSDTVAGESPRCSASSFRLTGLDPRRALLPSLLPFFFVVTLRSLAQSESV